MVFEKKIWEHQQIVRHTDMNRIEDGIEASLKKIDNLKAEDITVVGGGTIQSELDEKLNKRELLNLVYPIGSIYISILSTTPWSLFGGNWVYFGAGRTLVSVDSMDETFNQPQKTGGAKTHTLTVSEMPSHTHAQVVTSGTTGSASRNDHTADGNGQRYSQGADTNATGGGGAHNNMPPYITVYMWRRIS